MVHILGCHLSIGHEPVEPCLIGNKTSLAVGCRVAVYAAKPCSCQPWGFVGHHLGVYHLGYMAPNGIHGKGWRIRSLLHNPAFRHKPQLDQGLETVADAKHQSVTLI